MASPRGKISEHDHLVAYKIAVGHTNLVEKEQLEELKRPHALFLACKDFSTDETTVTIHYEKETGFASLLAYLQSDLLLKQKIAQNILQVEELIGTQYTTLLTPNNIFVNSRGKVKFAHRGIRSVLPPEEINADRMFRDVKDVIVFLLKTGSVNNPDTPANMLSQRVENTKTMKQLRELLSGDLPMPKRAAAPVSVPTRVDKTRMENTSLPKSQTTAKSKLVAKSPNPATKQNAKSVAKNEAKNAKQQDSKRKMLTGILVGLLIGLIAIYFIKVMPLEKEVATASANLDEKTSALEEEQGDLQDQLDREKMINQAYKLALSGKTEDSIKQFEKAKQLDDDDKKFLADQYMKLETPESLVKAVQLDDAYQVEAVNRLVKLNNDEAKKAILAMESTQPEVAIEQAWLQNDYKQVVDLSGKLADNKRAKELAARSYIELSKPKDAMKLAKELKSKDLQIASLNKEVSMVKADKKMKKDKRDKKLKALNQELKKLKK